MNLKLSNLKNKKSKLFISFKAEIKQTAEVIKSLIINMLNKMKILVLDVDYNSKFNFRPIDKTIKKDTAQVTVIKVFCDDYEYNALKSKLNFRIQGVSPVSFNF